MSRQRIPARALPRRGPAATAVVLLALLATPVPSLGAQVPRIRLGSYDLWTSSRLEVERTGLGDGSRVRGQLTNAGGMAARGSLSVNSCPAAKGGPHVRIDATVSPLTVDSTGFSRRFRIRSIGESVASPAPECLAVKPSDLAGRAVYREQWTLMRPEGRTASDADALIIQPAEIRGPRPVVRVMAGGKPVPPRNGDEYVGMYRPTTANVMIEMDYESETIVPLGYRIACTDCLPTRRDSVGVSITTVGQAMRATGMPMAPGRPGWTEVRTVLSKSGLRSRILQHLQSLQPPCPIAATFDENAVIVCTVPDIRFVPEGVEVEMRVRPVTWNGADSLWTRMRLVYPLRPINLTLLFREPSRVDMEAPIQTTDTPALHRLVGANPIEILPLSYELALSRARFAGNACLLPELERAVPPVLTEGTDDTLLLTLAAPVVAVERSLCPTPPAPATRSPRSR